MNKLTTIIFLFAAFQAFGQQQPQTETRTSYIIEPVRPDSFFLVEIIETVNPAIPRPSETLNYQLFRSPDELTVFLENRKKQVEAIRQQAAKFEQLTKLMDEAANANRQFLGLDNKKRKTNKP